MSPTGVSAHRDGWRMAAPGLWIHPTHGAAHRLNSRWWTWTRGGVTERYQILLSIIHEARKGHYPTATKSAPGTAGQH